MLKDFDETELDSSYYLVQKNVGSNWVDRGRFPSKQEAYSDVQKKVQEDIEKNNIFIYRVIMIEELILIKSKEKKPDDMLSAF